MPTAITIFNKVVKFFRAQSGGRGSKLIQEDSGEICLLRVACMGNPEKTIQGVLFNYLHSVPEIYPISEYHHYRFSEGPEPAKDAIDQSVDIMVFNRNHQPIVAIELKHHSLQQGSVSPLLDNLGKDYPRAESLHVPLIQIGLYTQLEFVSGGARLEDFCDYRFITAYAFHRRSKKLRIFDESEMTKRLMDGKSKLENWAAHRFNRASLSFSGPSSSFTVARTGHEIRGRVHYFIGLHPH